MRTDQSPTKSISEPQHILANGFANAWLINASGVHDVAIVFSLQPVFDAALLTSFFSLVSIGLLSVIYHVKRKRSEGSLNDREAGRDKKCAFD